MKKEGMMILSKKLDIVEETEEPIHELFGLTYASYLVLPRSAMQSMPKEWQRQLIKLVDEIELTLDLPGEEGEYSINRVNDKGKFTKDPLRDYERGRRRFPIRYMKKEKVEPIEIPKDNQDQEREDWKSIEETIFGTPKELLDGK